MPRILLDTGPVIRHLRGHRASVQLLRSLARRQRLAVSAVTRLEVFAGMQPDETYDTRRLLSRFHTYTLDRQTGDTAGSLIAVCRRNGLIIAVPDAIIAATAVVNQISLLTFNPSHFEFIPGLRLYPLSNAG